MITTTPEVASRSTKPLLVALTAVSCVAVAEAVVILLMIVGGRELVPAPPPSPPSATAVAGAGAGSAQPTATAAGVRQAGDAGKTGTPQPGTSQGAAGTVRGKRGERVDSDGLAITVEKINYKPVTDPLNQVDSERRYLALLVLVENNTGRNISFFDTSFRMQDGQNFEYEPLAMKLTGPALSWRNMGNRETMRGWVDFIVPRSSKGLELVYTHLARPIRVDLGE